MNGLHSLLTIVANGPVIRRVASKLRSVRPTSKPILDRIGRWRVNLEASTPLGRSALTMLFSK